MASKSPDGKNLRAGHRQRMRERLLKDGRDTLRDDEVLEMLLFYAIPRGDVKDLSKLLMDKFGGIEGVIFASQEDLEKISGIGDSTIALFALLQRMRADFNKNQMENNILSNWQAVIDYCRNTIGFSDKEIFMALFLNSKHRLLHSEELARGTINKVTVYPREVLEKAITHKATAVILVHNHPTGDVTPSKQDIEVTGKIHEALATINIDLFDHLIVSPSRHTSFKSLGLIGHPLK